MLHPHAHCVIIAATFFLMEMNDMSNHERWTSHRFDSAPRRRTIQDCSTAFGLGGACTEQRIGEMIFRVP
jgi:hypothetical protein